MNEILFGNISVLHFIILSSFMFVIGVCGIILNQKNVITVLMSVELMLLAVNLNFVMFSVALGTIAGQIFSLFVLTVAAAEAAIGLAILVIFARNRGSIAVNDVSTLKG
jgi:NADH-quinone oxidoreductase subunit K